MTTDLLAIAASNGENLKLAKRFASHAGGRGLRAEVLDLTTWPLPLYNPRHHAETGIPAEVAALSLTLESVPRWVICAPEYNGSITPILTSAIAWLSVQGEDFRRLFNSRPVAIASHSGGGGTEMLAALRIQLAHIGAHVVGRQISANATRPAADASIADVLDRLLTLPTVPLS